MRSIVSEFTHYNLEYDAVLATPQDRLFAFYYIVVKKMMAPAKKRNNIEQHKMNITCSAIFEKEMINELKAAIIENCSNL